MAPDSPLAVAVGTVAILLAGLAVWGLVMELPDFWDPCMEWGIGQSSNGTSSATLSPSKECPRASGTSETRIGAALRLAAVDGSAILAAGLALAGAWRRSWRFVAGAGGIMAGETVLLFFGLSIAFVLTLAAAIVFLVAARHWSRSPRPPRGAVSDGL